MRILVVGEQSSFEELKLKLGKSHNYESVYQLNEVAELDKYDLIIDFIIDEYPENYEYYMQIEASTILLNTVRISLGELSFTFGHSKSRIIGFNGLPTFVNRDLWEFSSLNRELNVPVNKELGDYIFVDDRVGLVTPRIILMIINEAFYTVQERTASKEDIDLGMKLGTNYPYGPFEWAEKIGIDQVYETLEAIYDDTKDERYKIAPLLKKAYLSYERT